MGLEFRFPCRDDFTDRDQERAVQAFEELLTWLKGTIGNQAKEIQVKDKYIAELEAALEEEE